MRYQITHQIRYRYDQPVLLAPHLLRLRPRCDSLQKLHQFHCQIDPVPPHQTDLVDLDGNAVAKIWFANEPTDHLTIETTAEVETFCANPFHFLLEPWAITLPIDYPVLLSRQLQPYLAGQFGGATTALDPVAVQLAQEIWMTTAGNVVSFLIELNQQLYQHCGYTLRETGSPYPPGITWTQQSGSCRDSTVLWMEVCRAVGLATRFVSGYQEGDPDQDERHLHAWAEVYLPGAGWRGYDPTHGLAVSDRHIALAASPHAKDTTPVTGAVKTPGIASQMEYDLRIQALSA
jgi:transglutaminase-like putative cysteine protease